jgi:hypothetical protein
MKGDFSRNTFDPRKHFTRVLMQQGRVQLDADWNEQAAILLHYVRTLAADLIGPHGGPGDGFAIEPRRGQNGNSIPCDFVILPGHYYVDGFLCENEGPLAYTGQPDYPLRGNQQLKGNATYLVYIDVWERHITYVEDTSIREVALGGPDTATRARMVWQVKVVPIAPGAPVDVKNCDALLRETLAGLDRLGEIRLRARARLESLPEDPSISPPEARYQGAENQLYRVEVHYGSDRPDGPTFKWSRENGSVVFPILAMTVADTTTVTLEHLGSDGRFGLAAGDWVEIVDDDYVLQGRADALWQVDAIDLANMKVTLKRNSPSTSPVSDVGQDPSKHPLLRRWDHKGTVRGRQGCIVGRLLRRWDHEGDSSREGGLQLDEGTAIIVEGEGEDGWLILEEGVQIQFQKPARGQPENQYRTGDYWLIPARTATRDVEWPCHAGDPEAMVPHGVEHHYAPLAVISVGGDGEVVRAIDCRRTIRPLVTLSE